MGCHTWCYVSLPEKQRDWREYLVRAAKKEKRDIERVVKDPQQIKDIVDDYRSEYERNIKNLKVIIEKETDSEKLAEYKNLLSRNEQQYKSWSLESLTDQYKKALEKANKFLDKYEESFLDNPEQFFSWWSGIPEEINDLGLGDSYLIKDNKIFRDNKLGKLKHRIIGDYDFRISNYDADPCYTAQDCFDRCKEEQVILSEITKQRLIQWFSDYPDTIIEFG